MIFTKEDMLFKDSGYYDWGAEEKSDPVSYDQQKVFNKKKGTDVLNFINHFCVNYNASTCTNHSFHKLEMMIRKSPDELEEPLSIAKWILLNWDNYNIDP